MWNHNEPISLVSLIKQWCPLGMVVEPIVHEHNEFFVWNHRSRASHYYLAFIKPCPKGI